jgi:hypothetical protein
MKDACYKKSRGRAFPPSPLDIDNVAGAARYSIALVMSSTTFFASPNTIMVLSM